MKKLITLCLVLTVFASGIFAQLSSYGFSAYSSTYTPITGTTAPLDYVDNGRTGLLPIGFSFVYDGASYTALEASTNGMVKLGATFLSNNDVSFIRTLVNNPERPILAPLWDDLMVTSLTDLSYQTTGSSPNKIFTLQWALVKWPYANSNASIEFQLKLYEGSNKIEFIYNQLPGITGGAGALIGISAVATGPGNYWCVQSPGASPAVSSTTQTLISTKPANGQVYAFQPLAACSTPLSAGTTVSSENTVCNTTNFNLSVNGASQATGLSYQWQSSTDNNNWQDITGATGIVLATTQTASKYYRRSISCGASTSYSSSVLVSQMATPAITSSGATSFCQGNFVALTSSAATGNQWYNNGTAISGATGPVYNAGTNGNYTVISTVGSCSSSASSPVTITVNPIPAQSTITVTGATTFCQGGSVTLTSSIGSGNQWYLNGTAISGAASASYIANQQGNYTVIVTSNGCSSPASAATVVTVNAIPNAPVISLAGNTFSSSVSSGNQWFRDGVSIPGATGQNYQASSFGSYTSKLTVNSCTSTASNALTFIPTGINSPSLEKNIVITNPVRNELLISYKGNEARFDLVVSDLNGRTIAHSTFNSNYKLNMRSNTPGVYLLRIINRRTGEQLQQLIIKE